MEATRLVRPEGRTVTGSPLRITPEVTCPAYPRKSRVGRITYARQTACPSGSGRRRYAPSPDNAAGPSSKIPFALFDLHGAFAVVIDDTILPLRSPEQHHLLDDLRHGI